MTGICGWYGDAGGSAKEVIDAMQRRFAWRSPGTRATAVGARFGIAAVGPAGTAAILESGPIHVAVQGHPMWRDRGARGQTIDAFCQAIVASWIEHGDEIIAQIGGDFALALIDERNGRALLAIDRIGVRNIVYQCEGGTLIFGATSDVLNAHPQSRAHARAAGPLRLCVLPHGARTPDRFP